MRETLLDMVQSILSKMDSEEVNSINDSVEAIQVADIIQDCYYDLVTDKEFPEHVGLLRLTSLSDSERPTHLRVPNDTRAISNIYYNISDTSTTNYRKLTKVSLDEFLTATDNKVGSAYKSVLDVESDVNFYIRNDRDPSFFTVINDYYIVCDSYDSTKDSTLMESKTRATGVTIPTFTISDTFKPDLDAEFLPLLLSEATKHAMSVLKGGVDAATVQNNIRLRGKYLSNLHKLKDNYGTLNGYGRR